MAKSNTNKQRSESPPWGGTWTMQKLDAFVDYVKAYLTIMKKNRYWKTIYFDGFAGSGERLKKAITHIRPERINIRQKNCNDQMPKLAEALKSGKFAALLFIDPFGMQIN